MIDEGAPEAEDQGNMTGSEDSDADMDLPDTHCPACEQEFGTQDQGGLPQIKIRSPEWRKKGPHLDIR